MTTEKQRLANQENARKSTGPRTEEGKARARKNALKHGLAGDGVVMNRADEKAFKVKLDELNEQLEPVGTLEKTLVSRMALATMRMDKCVRKDFQESARRQRRAVSRWEQKQNQNVAGILEYLEEAPAETLAALESTSFGCTWLVDEWRILAALLEEQRDWTYEQAARALRVLGFDPATPLPADATRARAFWDHAVEVGMVQGEAREALLKALGAIIGEELARLSSLREKLWNDDERPARTDVEACAGADTSEKALRRHRFERDHELSLHRNLNQLLHVRKIEPEYHSVERWHKTGKLKTRRWDGTNYVPTNPYVMTSAAPEAPAARPAEQALAAAAASETGFPRVEAAATETPGGQSAAAAAAAPPGSRPDTHVESAAADGVAATAPPAGSLAAPPVTASAEPALAHPLPPHGEASGALAARPDAAAGSPGNPGLALAASSAEPVGRSAGNPGNEAIFSDANLDGSAGSVRVDVVAKQSVGEAGGGVSNGAHAVKARSGAGSRRPAAGEEVS